MENKFTLGEAASLMRMSAGMPGKVRKDKAVSDEVKATKNLGAHSGAWIKNKYPDWALAPIEKLINEARAYHAAVTLPFDAGIGILPAALIMEYGSRMQEFGAKFTELKEKHFKAKYPDMIEWAKAEHNGTFDASDYPDVDIVMEAFYFRIEPLPVPDAGHFKDTIKSLLGVDCEQVNYRVQDAVEEARRELMRRMIEPVKAIAAKLVELPKPHRDGTPLTDEEYAKKLAAGPTFRDTLVQNIKDIVALAPKLNITGDPEIDACVKEMEKLTVKGPEQLRESAKDRKAVAADAMEVLKRLEGYKI